MHWGIGGVEGYGFLGVLWKAGGAGRLGGWGGWDIVVLYLYDVYIPSSDKNSIPICDPITPLLPLLNPPKPNIP